MQVDFDYKIIIDSSPSFEFSMYSNKCLNQSNGNTVSNYGTVIAWIRANKLKFNPYKTEKLL